MVARNYLRLIISILLFLNINTILIGKENMNNIEININNAINEYKSKNLQIIDIRTIKEWKMTGVIPNSFLINMHGEDFSENTSFVKNVEKVLKGHKEAKIAFICASGARSEIAANYFLEKNYKNIFHIPEGILGKEKDGWLYLGFPIESYEEVAKEQN